MTSTKLIKRLELIARRDYEQEVADGYTICFEVCAICGLATWSCSKDPGKGFKVEVDEKQQYRNPCERCRVAYFRSPEVFHWVIGVLTHQEELRESKELDEAQQEKSVPIPS